MNPVMTPGAIIRNRLEVRSLTITQLAALAGVSQAFMSVVVNDRQRPSVTVAEAIFDALDLAPLDRLTCIDGWTDPIMKPWNALRLRSVPTITIDNTREWNPANPGMKITGPVRIGVLSNAGLERFKSLPIGTKVKRPNSPDVYVTDRAPERDVCGSLNVSVSTESGEHWGSFYWAGDDEMEYPE